MYLYLLTAKYFTLNRRNILQEAFKIGTTLNPSRRLISYQTSHASQVSFKYLFQLDKSVFKNDRELYLLDAVKLPQYLKNNNLNYLHCDRGGGREWYWRFEEINYEIILKNFLEEETIPFQKISPVCPPLESKG